MSRRRITGLLLAAVLPIAAGCAGERVQPPVAQNSHVALATPTPTPTPAAAGRITLPMRVVNSNGGTLIYIPIRVNGHGPYDFVLDTGSSNSSVDRSLVHKLGLRHTGEQHPVQGVTGSGVVPIVKVRRWTLGGVALRGKSLSVVDLNMGVAGLLGSDELRRFGDVTLDFRNNRLVFDRQ